MRMRVAQSGQDSCLAEIYHLCVRRYLHRSCRPDLGDAFTIEHHDLVHQHLAGLAVEQPTGANRYHAVRLRAYVRAAFGPETGFFAGPPPGGIRTTLLRPERACKG